MSRRISSSERLLTIAPAAVTTNPSTESTSRQARMRSRWPLAVNHSGVRHGASVLSSAAAAAYIAASSSASSSPQARRPTSMLERTAEAATVPP